MKLGQLAHISLIVFLLLGFLIVAAPRSFAADDYALLGNTVVRDRDFNEHGLASDNLADALTKADPDRFQEVPPA